MKGWVGSLGTRLWSMYASMSYVFPVLVLHILSIYRQFRVQSLPYKEGIKFSVQIQTETEIVSSNSVALRENVHTH